MKRVDAHGRERREVPDCLNGFGDGPKHCTLPVGHRGECNHEKPTQPTPAPRPAPIR